MNYLEKLPVTGYEPTKELARLEAPAEMKTIYVNQSI